MPIESICRSANIISTEVSVAYLDEATITKVA